MNQADFFKTGKNGCFRPDLDEYFVDGEPQPPIKTPDALSSEPPLPPAITEMIAEMKPAKKGAKDVSVG